MPFTFSHPAIVIPLAKLSRHWLSLSGLVAGSVAPDFEYFFRMRMYSGISHKPEGLVLFDLPTGLMLTFLFHDLIRNSLFDNSPPFVRSRVEIFKTFNWNQYFLHHWFAVIVSVLIGAMSHLFWDSFTHSYTFFVERYEILRWELTIFGIHTSVHRVIQHFSTVLGGAVIAYFFWKLPTHALAPSRASRGYWPLVVALTIIVSAFRLLLTHVVRQPALFIVTFISAAIVAVCVVSVLLRLKNQFHDVR
ncbi:MAG TPA: DUF4184 family protein [Cyclobacteriaceae bacterium]|nr:DUF4184 family protein [Cyclobacteriaceae bacterium]